jgi:hypothetical protein
MFMKYSITLLLLVMASADATAQQRKPYDGEVVRVTRTLVNQKELRFIYAENNTYSLTFTCNADQPTCEVPAVGRDHKMIARPQKVGYLCDNYDLQYIDPDGVEHRTIVCLDSAAAK